jgi:glutathione S-transferase
MDVILHQYAVSPFSEKVRKLLALKKLPWRAVEQPIVNPKPKLVPLTGGYRRIPVLQVGADVWCDTVLITSVLEDLRPEPTCFPGGNRGVAEIVAHWADHWLFMAVVPPAIAKLLPALPPEFMADRAALSPGFTAANLKAALPDAKSRVVVGLDWLDAQLASGRKFLLGDELSVADAACFHVLWFLRHDAESFAGVASRPALAAWFERVEAMGTGESTPLDADEALAIAKRARTTSTEKSDGSDPNGIRPGDAITVTADDYGSDPIRGTAVVVTAREIAVRREHPEVGEVVVHFPRAGYRVARG